MYARSLVVAALTLAACQGADQAVAPLGDAAQPAFSTDGGPMKLVRYPAEDPGPPLYTRVTPLLNQIFVSNGMVAITFYRDPACVPAETDLFAHIHPPGPGGPGAFGCTLLVEGTYTVEADAPLGTFPLRSTASGPAQVWFVPVADFQAATADGTFTMAELLALNPLRGTASSFQELLAPRMDRHHVVINSHGQLEDGRSFLFNVNHLGDTTRSIQIRIR